MSGLYPLETGVRRRNALPVAPFDRFLAVAALLLLAAVLAAIARGYGEWSKAPPIVWAHLATIIPALALTCVQMWRPKGDVPHRAIGAAWVSLLFGTAVISLFITGEDGSYSWIHALSFLTIATTPMVVVTARLRKFKAHRSTVRSLVVGALLVAGLFTFPFDRLLGTWLYG